MNVAVFKPSPLSLFSTTNFSNPNPNLIQLNPKKLKNKKFAISFRSIQISDPNKSNDLLMKNPNLSIMKKNLDVNEKLECLISEFRALSEPLDRVKRLLHYASVLPEFDELDLVESNRVNGCTAQVWLVVRMDEKGRMRFRVDSDSEITKGFCSCLIWLLDGATAEEVLKVRVDDLREMNVGVLSTRVSSRINTWHNVLISMQKRTKNLVFDRFGEPLSPLLPFQMNYIHIHRDEVV